MIRFIKDAWDQIKHKPAHYACITMVEHKNSTVRIELKQNKLGYRKVKVTPFWHKSKISPEMKLDCALWVELGIVPSYMFHSNQS